MPNDGEKERTNLRIEKLNIKRGEFLLSVHNEADVTFLAQIFESSIEICYEQEKD